MKPSWDEYFLDICQVVKKRSSCVRRNVGSVLVDHNNRIVSTGYNDSPRGGGNCFAGSCPRGRKTKTEVEPYSNYHMGDGFCIATHSEVNCLRQAWDHIISWVDFEKFTPEDLTAWFGSCTLYVSEVPCSDCSKAIEEFGIKRVFWPGRVESPMQIPGGIPYA